MIETTDSIGGSRSRSGFASSPPQSMGRFPIKKLLGQGGFASVYLAHDLRLNRNVAIKILKPTSFFSAEATTRFDREALLARAQSVLRSTAPLAMNS
ncbi:MAG: serine/threonine protein kinase [Mariniblastus sp.]|jgi:serine/threonine protein kinase